MNIDYNTIVLDRLKLVSLSRMSRGLLRDAAISVDFMMDDLRDQMVYRMEAEILAHQVGSEEFSFVERTYYDSWQERKVAELPRDSFRRRFWAFFYELDPNVDYGREIVHHVRVEGKNLFPEASTYYPPKLGRPVVQIQTSHWTEDQVPL